jgi:hypothetical protein
MKILIAILMFTLFPPPSVAGWSLEDPLFSRGEQEDTKESVEKAAQDIGTTVEQIVHDTGDTLEKAAHDTGDTLEDAAHDTGDTIEKAFQDTGAELGRLFKRVCEDWLNIPEGECYICWTSEGGGDGNGEVYACEGGDPDQGTPPSQISKEDKKTPTPEELQEFDKWVKASEPSYEELEPWESGLSRFLPGNKVIGTPLPEHMSLVRGPAGISVEFSH